MMGTCKHNTLIRLGIRLGAILSTTALFGLTVTHDFMGASVQAQTINDILRILTQPRPHQAPPPPVYSPPPPVYSPPPTYSPPPPAYSPPSPPPATVPPQLSRTEVQRTQQMLNELGYDAGPIDGVAGSRTLNALRNFQLDNDLPASGGLTKQAVATLAAIHKHASLSRSTGGFESMDHFAPHTGSQSSETGGIHITGDGPKADVDWRLASEINPPLTTKFNDFSSVQNSSLLKPLAFEYHEGLPVLTNDTSIYLLALMAFANVEPSTGREGSYKECSTLRLESPRVLRRLYFLREWSL